MNHSSLKERPEWRRGAIVLCGGQSRRMGRDKASLPFGPEETILQRVVSVLLGAVTPGPVVCVAAPGQSLPPLPPSVVVARDQSPDCGPLEAIALGASLLETSVGAVTAVGCDSPLLSSAVIDLLFRELEAEQAKEVDAAVAVAGERRQPLLATYRRQALHQATLLRNEGEHRLMSLLDRLTVREVDQETLRQVDPDLRSLLNCNTTEAYQEALRLAGFES